MTTYTDQAIILGFLLITLVVGVFAGRGIKDIKDYAIANKAYGPPVLVLTLVATMIGGGSATGYTAQIFADGLIFTLANGIGVFIGLMLLGRFIASVLNCLNSPALASFGWMVEK